MQGSLDLPPIVIRSSRTSAALMLLASAGFVAIGFAMLSDPKVSRWIAYLGIGFFGLGIPLFAWRLIKPDRLILAPEGITWRSVVRTSRWSWNDLQGFRPYAPTSRSTSQHIGFDRTSSDSTRDGGLRTTARAMTGVDGSFGGGWELGAADLADLLNRARARWVGRSR